MGAGQRAFDSGSGLTEWFRTPGAERPWPGTDRIGAGARLRATIAEAMEKRRLFVLLPFSMIAGLVGYALQCIV